MLLFPRILAINIIANIYPISSNVPTHIFSESENGYQPADFSAVRW